MAREKTRCECPFYGFEWPDRSNRLRPTGDSRCALIWDRPTRCLMEAVREIPSEHRCSVPIQRGWFVEMARGLIIFVTQDHPHGVSYSQWRDELLKK